MHTENRSSAFEVFEQVCEAARIPDGGARLDVLLRLPDEMSGEILRDANERLAASERSEEAG